MTDTPNPNTPSESSDPYKEPPNSTVDDWHGQVVDEAMSEADAALAAGASDEDAEERYDEAVQQAEGAAERDRP